MQVIPDQLAKSNANVVPRFAWCCLFRPGEGQSRRGLLRDGWTAGVLRWQHFQMHDNWRGHDMQWVSVCHVVCHKLSVCLSVCLPRCLSHTVCLSVCLPRCLPHTVCLSVCHVVCHTLSVCLSRCLSRCLSHTACLSRCLSHTLCLSVCLSVCHVVCHTLSVCLSRCLSRCLSHTACLSRCLSHTLCLSVCHVVCHTLSVTFSVTHAVCLSVCHVVVYTIYYMYMTWGDDREIGSLHSGWFPLTSVTLNIVSAEGRKRSHGNPRTDTHARRIDDKSHRRFQQANSSVIPSIPFDSNKNRSHACRFTACLALY